MPWGPARAREFTREANTKRRKEAWSKVANQSLAEGKSEGAAIRIANAAVKNVGARRPKEMK